MCALPLEELFRECSLTKTHPPCLAVTVLVPGLVLRHKDSRHQIVREAVLGIMPVLARADPEKFVEARAGRGMRRGQNGEMRVTGSGDSLAGQGQSAFADAAFRGDDSKMPWYVVAFGICLESCALFSGRARISGSLVGLQAAAMHEAVAAKSSERRREGGSFSCDCRLGVCPRGAFITFLTGRDIMLNAFFHYAPLPVSVLVDFVVLVGAASNGKRASTCRASPPP